MDYLPPAIPLLIVAVVLALVVIVALVGYRWQTRGRSCQEGDPPRKPPEDPQHPAAKRPRP